jgi:ABC-2 type transport system permease protein
MNKVWVVVRREFLERVRSKWFIVSTVLGPLLMLAFIAIPIIMASRGTGERRVAVLDASSQGFGERLAVQLDQAGLLRASRVSAPVGRLEEVADSLAALVGLKVLHGFLIVTDAAVENGTLEYRGSNVTSPTDMRLLEGLLEDAVFAERLSRAGVDPSLVRRARIPLEFKTLKITGSRTTQTSGEGSFLLAYVIWFLLYMGILLYGANVLGAVVEDKTSRVVELLVSSLRPFELLAGKILGVGSVGLLQFGIWVGFAILALEERESIARLLGQPGLGATGDFPEVPWSTAVIFLSYFLLGYFLYAAMFAAVGAMTGSEAEARQAANVVVMVLVLPSLLMIGILNHPSGSMAVALSLIPFTSPIAMPVRWAAGEVAPEELIASLVLVTLALWGVTWVAGRIYRVGILMYGKRPGLRELVRWVAAR